MNQLELLNSINRDVAANKIKHVQVLMCVVPVNGKKRLAIKFTSIDTKAQRDKVIAITGKYGESLELIGESKTTMLYAM